MQLVISKDELRDLVDNDYADGLISETDKKEVLNDIKHGNIKTMWIEDENVLIDFTYSTVTLVYYIGNVRYEADLSIGD
jgi:hypothetical protein